MKYQAEILELEKTLTALFGSIRYYVGLVDFKNFYINIKYPYYI